MHNHNNAQTSQKPSVAETIQRLGGDVNLAFKILAKLEEAQLRQHHGFTR